MNLRIHGLFLFFRINIRSQGGGDSHLRIMGRYENDTKILVIHGRILIIIPYLGFWLMFDKQVIRLSK